MKTKLKLNVTFPKQPLKNQFVKECVNYVVMHKVSKEYYVVLVVKNEVVFFQENCITYGSVPYLQSEYEIIRELTEDESYTIHGNVK